MSTTPNNLFITFITLNKHTSTPQNNLLPPCLPTQVFTGLTGEYGGNYGPPSGFNWNGDDEPVEINPNLRTYNAKTRVDQFVAQAMQQVN